MASHLSLISMAEKVFRDLGSVAIVWQAMGPEGQATVQRLIPELTQDDRPDLVDERIGIIAFEAGQDEVLIQTAVEISRRQARGLPFETNLRFIGPPHLVDRAFRILDERLRIAGLPPLAPEPEKNFLDTEPPMG